MSILRMFDKVIKMFNRVYSASIYKNNNLSGSALHSLIFIYKRSIQEVFFSDSEKMLKMSFLIVVVR